MNISEFDIFAQINKEIDDFYTNRIVLSGKQKEGTIRYLSKENSSHSFNQSETLQMIDMYWDSKFTTGDTDEQGRQKLFMNVGKFRTEVASKQIDIDAKDFLFYPEDYASTIGAWLMQQEFKTYAKETYFGELINECVEAFPKYGTIVLKKVGNKLEFLPLQTLRNDQSATSLNTSSYVIEEHSEMSFADIKRMEKNGWKTDKFSIDLDKTITVYERFGSVPSWYLKKLNDEEYDMKDYELVDSIIICTIEKSPKVKKRLNSGHIFYAKKISERPYREAHWSKQYGRWLGIGEMENQFPNQVAKNVLINILKNGFEWSSKRLFQTPDETVVDNLAQEVKDGDVLLIQNNGNISPIDLSARYGNEAQQMINEWEKNSDQKAFTYEVATGESLPSGTPFRLGVVLSNAVNSHFSLKREKLGILLKKAVMDFLIPDFVKKSSSGENTIIMNADAPGFEAIRAAAEDYTVSQVIKASIFSGKLIDTNLIAQLINPIEVANQLFIKRPASFYNSIKTKFDLTITGEETDIQKKITTLTTLYQVLAAQGDPRAEKVLARIMSLTGESMSTIGANEQTTSMVPNLPTNRSVNVKTQPEKKSSLDIPETTQS